VKHRERDQDEIRRVVRKRYAGIVEDGGESGCGTSCCGSSPPAERSARSVARGLGYTAEETDAAPEGANLGLGCGNPQAIARLREGETVLDLGSGAGFDAFLAARAVGPDGRVIGVDMTPEMISRARSLGDRSGHENVEFRLGEIEHLPAADASVDVILSNCVINLSPDQAQVYREAFRVLRPGGRLAVSDVVARAPLPDELREDLQLHAGCLAGAATVGEVRTMLADAGFVEIRIELEEHSREFIAEWMPGRDLQDFLVSARIEARRPGGFAPRVEEDPGLP
jgi:SAM-dependent methyltransferase